MFVSVIWAEIKNGSLFFVQIFWWMSFFMKRGTDVKLSFFDNGPKTKIHESHHTFFSEIYIKFTFAEDTWLQFRHWWNSCWTYRWFEVRYLREWFLWFWVLWRFSFTCRDCQDLRSLRVPIDWFEVSFWVFWSDTFCPFTEKVRVNVML